MNKKLNEIVRILEEEYQLNVEVTEQEYTNGVMDDVIRVSLDDTISAVIRGSSIDCDKRPAPIIAKELVCVINTNRGVHFDVEDILHNHDVVYTALNYELNKRYESSLSYKFLDLLFVPTVILASNEEGTQTIKLTQSIIDQYLKGLSKEDVIEKTKELCHTEVRTMGEILSEYGFDTSMIDASPFDADAGMFVVQSDLDVCTVASGFLGDTIKEFSDRMKRSIVVLPSSIHELLLVPLQEFMSIDELLSVVKSVNETEVDERDFLSDSVYLFNYETKELEVYEKCKSKVS